MARVTTKRLTNVLQQLLNDANHARAATTNSGISYVRARTGFRAAEQLETRLLAAP